MAIFVSEGEEVASVNMVTLNCSCLFSDDYNKSFFFIVHSFNYVSFMRNIVDFSTDRVM